MGGFHASILSKFEGVSIAGVVDNNRTRAGKLARIYAAKAFTDSKKAIRDACPDVIFITTPTPVHARYALEAAAAGIPAFCEKPLARNIRDGEKVVAEFKRRHVPLTVGQVVRFFPEYARIRDLVQNGTLGRPAVVRTSRGGGFPRATRDWYADFRQSGGPLFDMGIHDLDWLSWTFGPVCRVHARSVYRRGNPRSYYDLAVIRHRSGTIAHVEAFWGHDLPFRTHVEVAGDKSLIDYDLACPPPLEIVQSGASESRPGVAVPESPLAQSPFELQDRAFIDSIVSGRPPAVSPEEALAALRVACACLDSIRTGKAVRLA